MCGAYGSTHHSDSMPAHPDALVQVVLNARRVRWMSRCSIASRAVFVLWVCQRVNLVCSELWHERWSS